MESALHALGLQGPSAAKDKREIALMAVLAEERSRRVTWYLQKKFNVYVALQKVGQ